MGASDREFREAVEGLLRGDFSRLESLFIDDSNGKPCQIIQWCQAGCFDGQSETLAEALSCACFNGRTDVARYLLDKGINPASGNKTGLNAFHWAANRGHLDTVKLLIARKSPLEELSMYGGTVLGTAVWAGAHEPKREHLQIIEALIKAGANLDAAGYPSGSDRIDELLRRHGARV